MTSSEIRMADARRSKLHYPDGRPRPSYSQLGAALREFHEHAGDELWARVAADIKAAQERLRRAEQNKGEKA